ncbi:MAG: glutamine-hydrolyzing carbamoyl-phosphate synthase small subunit [Flavobacteriales bacterium]|nr:glutamine-hydrolyzing carbamoyl-phosphate synthase small subunit [Flavobacteriales bacterium]MDA9835423.1 glutamine-hydrolyzing carbamoyl-phosphate synthase small subunit [Flavobacteriales bacterium]
MQGLRHLDLPAILLLEDGTIFKGKALGAQGTTYGEIAFNTGMYGYQEIFTDPSYHKQMLVMATAHIGNYGVHDDEVESSNVKVAGIVVRNFSSIASRVDSSGTLQADLEKNGTVGISDVDTRALVRHIRNNGAMNAVLSTQEFDIKKLRTILDSVPSMDGLELSSEVSVTESFDFNLTGGHKVALIDFGFKKSIATCLSDRGCSVRVFPWNVSAEEVLEWSPDGIMLSNGPGDPSAMKSVIAEVGKLVESELPIFGICLGHQLLSLSQGLETTKMFNGHRGVNHPVKNLITGKCEITSQNHGFVVSHDSVKNNTNVEVTHIHLNDDTIAGIRLVNKPVFCVQYHPEASAGPHDSRYLFDDFVELITEFKYASVK